MAVSSSSSFWLWLISVLAAVTAPTFEQTGVRTPERSIGVDLVRVPDGGVQPEVAVDSSGTVHMVYLHGEPASADVFYVQSTDGGRTFSTPLRVNSQVGSAIATGTIRGAQIALGRGGRVHVVWNGSSTALPAPPRNRKTNRAGMPMLYSRSNASRTAFEPQRNLITGTTNLDGGGSVAADAGGRVYVAWHAHPDDGEGGEDARRVWIAQSDDDGATFSRERPISNPSTGVCGCCALRIAATKRDLQVLYRSATANVHRDIYALVSRDRGQSFTSSRLHEWEIGACPMTSMDIVAAGSVLRAWETDGQVYFTTAGSDGRPIAPPPATIDPSARRKHPRLAVDARGTVLLAWTEGTAWARGGSLAWQAFDAGGTPTPVRGTRAGVPVWSFVSVVARPDGNFTIIY